MKRLTSSWACAAVRLSFALTAACGGLVTPSSGEPDAGGGSSSGAIDAGSGGSSSSSGSSGSSSGGSSSGGSSSGGSSSGTGGSSGGAPGGTITFAECTGSTFCNSGALSSFSAQFLPPPGQAPACTVTQAGACAYTTCSDEGPRGGVSAGTVTIAGGSLPGVVDVPFGANGVYAYGGGGSKPLFAPGDVLTVTASGGTFPAFGPETVASLPLVTLTSPAPSGGPFDIPRSDLQVAWTGGQPGATFDLETATIPLRTGSGARFLRCTWDAGAGQGTVPYAAFSDLVGESTMLVYAQYAPQTFTAGAYTITEVAIAFSGGWARFE